MSLSIFVDPDNGDDSYDGTTFSIPTPPSLVGPKRTINGAMALITGPITVDTIIALKNTTHHVNANIQGIVCLLGSSLIFEPYDVSDGTLLWNQHNYDSGTYDPFDPSDDSGTFNEESDNKPAILDLQMSIEYSQNVEFRGLKFLDADAGGATNHVIYIRTRSIVKFTYCRFDGFSAGFNATYGIMTLIENCYFKGQQIGILCSGSSQMALMGKCHIIDAVYRGIFAVIDSTIMILPWFGHTQVSSKLTIKTTQAPTGPYAAIEADVNATIYIQTPMPVQVSPFPGACKLAIENDDSEMGPDYKGIILGARSLLVGRSRIKFTTKDLDNVTTVSMPVDQQIVMTGDGVVTSG